MSVYDSDSSDDETVAPPIGVAARRRGNRGAAATKRLSKRYDSPLFDDRGFTHPQDDWESMLPDVKDGRLIHKRLHEPPNLQAIDPDFGEEYNVAKHGDTLRTELNIAHLTPFQRSTLTAIIKKYW